ncbi:sensor histidine kinase [Joostella atrarenae]|uniref:histidine kinase n=1 Tax=Joostella atrarenae TaxID=679257 RepID=A0ABS9J1D7_9FLAO|nr:sensor histidine kinase [Joostella atrarenae]MCF8714232.1 sensor histidine kinase [Joostella atrarenae]
MENEKEIVSLIIYVSALIVILVIFVVAFFLVYQRRKTQLLLEKVEERRKFEHELAKAQTEIQEQTFKNISWELHDNIGQLLTVAKMQLNMLQSGLPEEKQKSFDEASNVLGQGVNEIRQLSHSLNTNFISKIGLQESLEREINRFKRLNFLEVEYEVEGDPYAVNKKDEIIIFRIFQECFSNVVKYSKATLLTIKLSYTSNQLSVVVKDNGVGFDINEEKEGTGLLNMKMRAALIGANFSIQTQKNEGVSVTLVYPTN